MIVDQDIDRTIRSLGLTPDREGNVIAIERDARHLAVMEALAYTVYGSARERSAGSKWLEARRTEVLSKG